MWGRKEGTVGPDPTKSTRLMSDEKLSIQAPRMGHFPTHTHCHSIFHLHLLSLSHTYKDFSCWCWWSREHWPERNSPFLRKTWYANAIRSWSCNSIHNDGHLTKLYWHIELEWGANETKSEALQDSIVWKQTQSFTICVTFTRLFNFTKSSLLSPLKWVCLCGHCGRCC